MPQKRFIFSIALFLGLLVILVAVGDTSQAAQTQAAPIRLQAATFVPVAGERPQIPPGLTIRAYAAGQSGYYILQFKGPVQQAWKNDVEALGGEILGYIPDFAFKVRLNPAQAARAAQLDSVAWVGLYQPAYKISPEANREGTNLYRVVLEQGANRGQTRAALAQSGAQVLSHGDDIFLVAANAEQLEAMAHILDVAWIENFIMPQTHNEYGAGIILGANTANANGYDGSTQTVAVADTGLGGGTAASAHPDIPSNRITAVYNLPGSDSLNCYNTIDDGAVDVDSGHGTHTALSVLSDGDSVGKGRGTAPAAWLVFQAIEDFVDFSGNCSLYYPDGYYLMGIPDDLHDLFQQAYDAGARVHSNSWGSAVAGAYTTDSANTDDFIWNNPDLTITYSAGNEGVDYNFDGIVDQHSLGSPATAKNVIAVGASENDRDGNWDCDTSLGYTNCLAQGGQNDIFTYGEGWPNDFPEDPLYSDPSAGNAEQMAAFSSRGPTDDGRLKPDVVAPGTWVLSGYSDLYQRGYDGSPNPQNFLWQYDGWGYPYSQEYKYMGGTSMSNPLVAGGAAVVRDYYQKALNHDASSALVKATLINSAVDLLDENNDGLNDNAFPIPNYHEGWGRVDLAAATDGNAMFMDEANGLSTGANASYQYVIANPGEPFKVSLVWSDFASTTAASQNLVNDLDLVVTAPDGTTTYYGNVFSGGWSQTGGSADRLNNVENVYVETAATGTWTVEVVGYNVPNGPQPFALVVDGLFAGVDSPPSVSIIAPEDGAFVSGTVTIQIDATDVEDATGALSVEWKIDGGVWQSTDYMSGTIYEATWDTTTATDGGHTLYARATDSASNVRSESQAVTVDNLNDPPVASFTLNCDILTCDFDASGSADPDGTITNYAWTFGDGGTATGVQVSHTYASAAAYGVTLTVTDDDGAMANSSKTISAVFITDIDGLTSGSRGNWTATAQITIRDLAFNPVQEATIRGIWSGGFTGEGSCTTGTWNGQSYCSISTSPLNKKIDSVVFTVTGISRSNLLYDASRNYDNDGTSNGTAIQINKDGTTQPPSTPTNQPPTANFSYTTNLLDVTFTDSSSDLDGSIVAWSWDFGDGNSSTEQNPAHPYQASGTYTVQLTATDDDGAMDSTSQDITVSDGNVPPVASFTYGCSDLVCDFDASSSDDSDGTITGYEWDFGDGSSSTEQNPAHTYAAPGTYTVQLTVTDDDGATNSTSQPVTVTDGSGISVTLSATGHKVKGLQKADLSWSGATGVNVDVYRDGEQITTTANDGDYTDNIDNKGGGSYTYQICETDGSACSNEAVVDF